MAYVPAEPMALFEAETACAATRIPAPANLTYMLDDVTLTGWKVHNAALYSYRNRSAFYIPTSGCAQTAILL